MSQRLPISQDLVLDSFRQAHAQYLASVGSLGSELLTNSDFENWSGGDPVDWYDWQGDSADETVEVQSGAHSVLFTLDIGVTLGSLYQDHSLTPGAIYRAGVWGKLGTADSIEISIWDLGIPAQIAVRRSFKPDVWRDFALYFKAPVSGDVRFQAYIYGAGSSTAYLDCFSLKLVSYPLDPPELPGYVAGGTALLGIDDHTDSFDDLDVDLHWNILRVGTGTVIEQNNRLECACPAHLDAAGLVSQNRYNLSSASLEIGANAAAARDVRLLIALTQVLSTHPTFESNYYTIWKRRDTQYWQATRCENGVTTTLDSGAWSAADSKLKIVIAEGTITFYEGDIERCSEAYQLSTYDCYIYTYAIGVTGYLGTNYFDNLTLSCTDSLNGVVALGREILRQPYVIRGVKSDYNPTFIVDFKQRAGTGVWHELGLFSQPAIISPIDGCESDIGWSTHVDNSLSPELSDYRAGYAALETSGPGAVPRFQRTDLRVATGIRDDFTDGELSSFWDQLISGAGNPTVIEQKGRLECLTSQDLDIAGVVSKLAHDLTTSEICVRARDLDNHDMYLQIALAKTTDSNPGSLADWYQVHLHKGVAPDQNSFQVHKRVAGGATQSLWDSNWASNEVQLRIRIAGGTIYFYENDTFHCSDAFALPSYTCYIYLWAYADGVVNHGLDYFDDFSSTIATPLSVGSYLQLFYYISDKALVSPASSPLAIQVGNDASNYWEFRKVVSALTDGWQWLSFRFSDYYSKTGSPAFNQLLKYFYVAYPTATLDDAFLDRMDEIRLFQENGALYFRAETEVGAPKWLQEEKHVLWQLRILTP